MEQRVPLQGHTAANFNCLAAKCTCTAITTAHCQLKFSKLLTVHAQMRKTLIYSPKVPLTTTTTGSRRCTQPPKATPQQQLRNSTSSAARHHCCG
jgi:hypothetical protein